MFYLFTIIALILDQASKFLVKSGFWDLNRIEYLNWWVFFQKTANTGAAFSFPIEWLPLQMLTILLIGAILYYYFKHEENRKNTFVQASYGLIIGSALSHAYERICVGHVVDFVWVKYFAIFNFADIFITAGAIILVLTHLWVWKQKK